VVLVTLVGTAPLCTALHCTALPLPFRGRTWPQGTWTEVRAALMQSNSINLHAPLYLDEQVLHHTQVGWGQALQDKVGAAGTAAEGLCVAA